NIIQKILMSLPLSFATRFAAAFPTRWLGPGPVWANHVPDQRAEAKPSITALSGSYCRSPRAGSSSPRERLAAAAAELAHYTRLLAEGPHSKCNAGKQLRRGESDVALLKRALAYLGQPDPRLDLYRLFGMEPASAAGARVQALTCGGGGAAESDQRPASDFAPLRHATTNSPEIFSQRDGIAIQ